MPLIASMTPKALKANIKKEIEAGKPPKQAVAIAYSVKREAAKKPAKKKRTYGYWSWAHAAQHLTLQVRVTPSMTE